MRDANLRGAGRVAHGGVESIVLAWVSRWRRAVPLQLPGAPFACAVPFTNALYCYCARAYLVSASYASRILKEQSVWKRPVPFSEPGAALFLTICSVSSP